MARTSARTCLLLALAATFAAALGGPPSGGRCAGRAWADEPAAAGRVSSLPLARGAAVVGVVESADARGVGGGLGPPGGRR
ncbi:MAG: hypothetical protein ACKOSS_12295, partial [Planctomycetia bacterium]